MNLSEYLDTVALRICGLIEVPNPDAQEKLMFVNDLDGIVRQRIIEAKTWYDGDSDRLANLYRVDAMIDFRTEPFYWKNRRRFFWATAVLEDEYKLSHSGFARDMVDTTVTIIGTPNVKCADPADLETLNRILDANSFWATYRQIQMPMTLVAGWGAYKIDWNAHVYGNVPCISFTSAPDVVIHKVGPMTIGMTFLHWYSDLKGGKMLLSETRAKTDNGTYAIEYKAFKASGDESLCECDPTEIPNMRKPVDWTNNPVPFAVPCSFYADTLYGYCGKGIFSGKIDLLDALDQALSQMDNTVRRAAPLDIFDLEYCERDRVTKLPKLPRTFERRFIGIRGAKNADGSSAANKPVDTIQPAVNVDMFLQHIDELKRTIIGGHLSPASMGLDVAKKDNADAQREKEKQTIFTRNHLTKEESAVLKELFNQTLIAHEFLAKGKITKTDYGVSVEYDEFSDASYESKMESLSAALSVGAISPRMFVERVYGRTISEEDKALEIKALEERHAQKQRMEQEEDDEDAVDDAVLGQEE